MKRIIEGNTYNTDTATLVAEGQMEDGGTRTEIALYQNPAGVYFNVDTVVTSYRDRHGEWNERKAYEWEIIGDAAKAREKCEAWGLTILRDAIEDMPPEAEPGEKMATLYIRLPPSLKSAIEARASSQNMSVNVFALRCLEGCAREPRAPEDTSSFNIEALMKALGLFPKTRENQKSVSWCLKETGAPLFYVNAQEGTVIFALGEPKTPSIANNSEFRTSVVKALQKLGLRNTGAQWPTVSLKYLDTPEKLSGFGAIVDTILAKATGA